MASKPKSKSANRSKDLLTDVGITIVVFMVATIMLGITNYRNNQTGKNLPYTEAESSISVANLDLADTIYVFHSGDEARQLFPQFTGTVDSETELLVVYAASPQPTAGYRIRVVNAERQGPVATIRYHIDAPLSDTASATVLTQPALFLTFAKADLASSSQFTFRFQNTETNQTSSLSIFPNEI